MIKLNKSILQILQVMKYCRTNNLFDSAQLKCGTVVVYSLFVVGPIGCGSYVEILVLCVVLGILSILAIVLLNASCNINMI